jgi:hypothetical protein
MGSVLFKRTVTIFLADDPVTSVRIVPRVSLDPLPLLLGPLTTESICHQLHPDSDARKTAPQVNFSQSLSPEVKVGELEA